MEGAASTRPRRCRLRSPTKMSVDEPNGIDDRLQLATLPCRCRRQVGGVDHEALAVDFQNPDPIDLSGRLLVAVARPAKRACPALECVLLAVREERLFRLRLVEGEIRRYRPLQVFAPEATEDDISGSGGLTQRLLGQCRRQTVDAWPWVHHRLGLPLTWRRIDAVDVPERDER